ncbi:MAG: PmoA family protein [Verrucomicrobia bacterium]|nr:PmoA family protein [Verrucomicrobiota bacterium]
MNHRFFLAGCRMILLLAVAGQTARSQTPSVPKPVPLMQAVPQPEHQISFQRDGREIARYHFNPALNRPFIFPVIGPSGRAVTRLGHPHDPEGHSHHNSIWISHHDVNGVTFWGDRGTNAGRIVHQRIEQIEDGADAAFVQVVNAWTDKNGRVLLNERRRITVEPLPEKEFLLILDVQLEARGQPVTLGKTPFGLLGVRMAKTIGVADGGGTIRNSAGNVNETGENGVHWKRAKWCDYSGPVTPQATEGLTLMDHPANPNHPTYFHVRNDGWMGAALTHDAPLTLTPGQPLQLRYGLRVHNDAPKPEMIQRHWAAFAKSPLPELVPKTKK